MNNDIKRTLQAAVLRLLRPLVRLLLHHSVPYETFADLARWVYVDVAEKDFALENKKQTTSRISVITGLNRKEVARLQAMDVADNTEAIASFNRAEKVVTAWRHEYPKADSPSLASPLPLEGERSFSSLVKKYSGDMPVRAVLDELLRVGVAQRTPEGKIELVAGGTILPNTEQSQTLVSNFGVDVGDFVETIAHNITTTSKPKLLQRKAWTDNLPVETLDVLRGIANQRGQAIVDEFIQHFSKFDRDITPGVEGSGRARAGFGVYFFEETLEPGAENSSERAKDQK